jgi:uncharacterized protein (DUF58 family)
MTVEVASAHQLRGATVSVEELIALRGVKLPLRTAVSATSGPHGGSRLSRHRGRGVDFAEVRLYQPGDDVRSIDWRVTARKAKPHTKVYREERERPTLIVVDQSRAMFFGSRVRMKSVAAAECAALLAWHSVDAGDRVGGLVYDDVTEYAFKPFRSARAGTTVESDRPQQRGAGFRRHWRSARTPLADGSRTHRARRAQRPPRLSDLRLPRLRRRRRTPAETHCASQQRRAHSHQRSIEQGCSSRPLHGDRRRGRSVLSTADARARQQYRDEFLAHTSALKQHVTPRAASSSNCPPTKRRWRDSANAGSLILLRWTTH